MRLKNLTLSKSVVASALAECNIRRYEEMLVK